MKDWRDARGLTLQTIAPLVRKSAGTLSRIENGRLPYNQDVLEAYADVVGCEPAELISRPPHAAEDIKSIWDRMRDDERVKALALLDLVFAARGADGGATC